MCRRNQETEKRRSALTARSGTAVAVHLVSFAAALLAPSALAQAGDFSLHLVDIGQARGFSQAATSLAHGGYELSDGTWVSFSDWYHTDWPELHAEFLAQLTSDFGVLWGLSTGERGEKYKIDPSVSLGVVAQTYPTEASVLSLTVTTTFGGQFNELPCEADYGTMAGVQSVNCRLAASHLPPSETLQYLAFAEPTRLRLSLNFRANF